MGVIVLNAFEEGDIEKTIRYLEEGEVVLFYSESVYGFAGNGYIREAVDRIYDIKGRSREKPLNVLATPSNFTRWSLIPEKWERAVLKLIEAYWPGNLGLILPKKETIPDYVNSGLRSVNLVCMDEVAYRMSDMSTFPVCVTSANFSGESPVTDPEEALDRFKDLVRIFLLGPQSSRREPTTIIDFSKEEPYILRQTTVSVRELEEVAGIELRCLR